MSLFHEPTHSSFAEGSGTPPVLQPGKRQRSSRSRTAKPHPQALFLDFDGVLHPTVLSRFDEPPESLATVFFGWLPAIVDVLRTYPDVAVVVHSTWRYTHDVDELKLLLGALGPRVVGATPRGPRFESIEWWLQMNPSFADHRILDDDASEFPSPPPPELILCNPTTGVAAPEVLTSLRVWLEG